MRTAPARNVVIPVALFLLGAAAGVLVQKYYGVGRVAKFLSPHDTAAADRVVPADTLPADTLPTVDPSVLSGKRVLVALVFGQSNAGNTGETRASGGDGVYVLHRGRLHPAVDPLPGGAGTAGSVWTRLGPRLLEASIADAVVFVPVSVGGTSIERWAPGGDLHPRLLQTLAELENAGVRLTHLFWHQGESDAERNTPPDVYARHFYSMLSALRDHGIDAPILVSVATLCRAHRPNAAIREAQKALVDRERGVFRGPDTDVLGYAYRYDGCHFSTEGLDSVAEAWLEAIREHVEVLPPFHLWPPSAG